MSLSGNENVFMRSRKESTKFPGIESNLTERRLSISSKHHNTFDRRIRENHKNSLESVRIIEPKRADSGRTSYDYGKHSLERKSKNRNRASSIQCSNTDNKNHEAIRKAIKFALSSSHESMYSDDYKEENSKKNSVEYNRRTSQDLSSSVSKYVQPIASTSSCDISYQHFALVKSFEDSDEEDSVFVIESVALDDKTKKPNIPFREIIPSVVDVIFYDETRNIPSSCGTFELDGASVKLETVAETRALGREIDKILHFRNTSELCSLEGRALMFES